MGEGEDGKKVGKKEEKVALYKLFSFADSKDVLLMLVGGLAAVGSGLAMPLMTFIFGKLINAFGVANRESVVHDVSKVACRHCFLFSGNQVDTNNPTA